MNTKSGYSESKLSHISLPKSSAYLLDFNQSDNTKLIPIQDTTTQQNIRDKSIIFSLVPYLMKLPETSVICFPNY